MRRHTMVSALTIVSCLLASGCDRNSPVIDNVKSCSNADAVNLVVKTARENPDIATKIIQAMPDIASESVMFSSDTYKNDDSYKDIDNQALRLTSKLMNGEGDSSLILKQVSDLRHQQDEMAAKFSKDREEKYKADVDQNLLAVTYKLEDTTLTDKDAQTSNVKCSATLVVGVPHADQVRSPVIYRVEETSEGKPNVTVYGLTPDG